MRTPRVVPEFERSPAPRAPYPRIMRRMSLVPYRDCATTPGTIVRASSRPYPFVARSEAAVTFVIASGVVRIGAATRVAVTLTVGNATAVSRGGVTCPSATSWLTEPRTSKTPSCIFMMHPLGEVGGDSDRADLPRSARLVNAFEVPAVTTLTPCEPLGTP